MGLSGNLRTMDLPEILQWISSGRKTGTLHIERRSVQKRISFRDGVIYTSWSNDPRESLGQFLVRFRAITEEQLFRALLRQESEGKMLGSILVADGLITEDDLLAVLKAKAEETVYDLFLWPEGKFEFKDGDVPQNVMVHLRMDVTSVTLEGVRRVDEWSRIREVFPSLSTTLRVLGEPAPGADQDEVLALRLAAAGKSVAEISLELRRSEFDGAGLIYDLYRNGLVAPDKVGEDARGGDTIATIQELLASAAARLKEKRYDAALAAYEQVLSYDRLNQNAKKGLIAVIESRNRERTLKSVPLDKVPVLRMSFAELTKENFDPHEGFVISRVNGMWDVHSILKLCPMGEEEALLIFARLMERKVIEMT